MSVLPTDLTKAERDALRLAVTATLVRRTHGWNAAGAGRRISKATGSALISHGLAREDHSRSHPRLVATGAGRDLLHVIELRAERRERMMHMRNERPAR